MERYTDNGLCNYIENAVRRGAETNLKFYDLSKSLLVVARKEDNWPIAMFIDDRCSDPSENAITPAEREYGKVCYRLARKAGLPLVWIRYIDDHELTNDSVVYLAVPELRQRFYRVKIGEIARILRDNYGIDCVLRNKTPQKEKNDSLSSAFHLWQRECLDIGIFADIDLIRVNNDSVSEIIELKRSYLPLETWTPFPADSHNFEILKNLCTMLGNIPFRIVFNTQVPYGPEIEKNPKLYYQTIKQRNGEKYYDKLDKLKVFDTAVTATGKFYTPCKGIVSTENFLLGKYPDHPKSKEATPKGGLYDVGR